MQIGPEGFFHLTYCTKIHPGRGWEELFGNLRRYAPALKARLAPEAAPSAWACACPRRRPGNSWPETGWRSFRTSWPGTTSTSLPSTASPTATLTGPAVKARIFAPDWREEARVRYTLDLIEILRRLLPTGAEGSISTTPLSYKAWIAPGDAEAWAQMTRNLVRVTERLAQIKAEEGKLIHLDLEPEPDGLLEVSREVVDFFRDWLLKVGAPVLAERPGSVGRSPPAFAGAYPGLPGHLPPGGGA